MYQNIDDKRHILLGHDKIKHCEEVARFMYEYAAYFGVHPDIAYFTGLNHDIGYLNGRVGHEQSGKELFNRMGVDNEISYAIAMHGKRPSEVDEHKPLLDLLWCADMSIDKNGQRIGFIGRLQDIEDRYGSDSVAYKTAKETSEYCRQIFDEKTMIQPSDFCVDFDEVKDINTGFSLKLKPTSFATYNQILYLKEFAIDVEFCKKYNLPLSDIVYVGKDDNGELKGTLFLEAEPSVMLFYKELKSALSKKDTENVKRLTKGAIKEDMPYEVYAECEDICNNMRYGFKGENCHTHTRQVNLIINDEHTRYLLTKAILEPEKDDELPER